MNSTVGIICAMEAEAKDIISAMENAKEEKISGVTYVSGKIHGKSCVVAVCGIGKVFAALCAQTMILKYSPSLIINCGVAGGLSPELSICDIAIATSLVQHDMDTSAIGDPKGLISGINIINIPCDPNAASLLKKCAEEEVNTVLGVIASGDKFMSDYAEKENIRSTFNAIACEMEGAAVGQVCYVNNVPCCVMRAISDGGDENAHMDYPTFAVIAAARAARVILKFLES